MGFDAGAQRTLADRVTIEGRGVHSNAPVTLTLHPADPNSGIIFLRTNLAGSRDVEIRASWEKVSATALCTVLGDLNGAYVSTVEHLMAALRALGIDNVLVELDGPELPIEDGSSAPFIAAIDRVGTITQAARRRYIRVLKPVRVESKGAFGELRPYDGFRYDVTIDFDTPVIGRQSIAFDLTEGYFRKELSRARTFGFLKDLETMLKMGFARGSSLENSVAISEDRVLNPEGLRYANEFVRHKALDAIGDLSLAGAPLLGAYRSYKGGHRLNFAMLHTLFEDKTAWEVVEAPVRRETGHAELPRAAAAVFGPETA